MPIILRFKKKKKKRIYSLVFNQCHKIYLFRKIIYLEKLLAIFIVQLRDIYSSHMNNKSHHKFKK